MRFFDDASPIRFGIIGCGALGLIHAQRLSAQPNVHVTAVSDPSERAMANVAAAVPSGSRGTGDQVAKFADYRAMLDAGSLDAIVINSPNRWHVEQLLASLERGLHVLCEKPLSLVPHEVTQVTEASERAGKLVAIAYQSRYRRDARILKSLLNSGRFGRVTSVNILNSEDWVTGNRGTWRHDPAQCPGGFFADANGHQLDALFWMTGLQPLVVTATIENRGTPIPIVTSGGESYLASQGSDDREGAAPFSFMFVGDAKLWREEISIVTEGADFVMRDTRLLYSEGGLPLAPLPDAMIDPHVNELPDLPDTAFVAALRGGPPIISPPETVWPVVRFTLAALESASHGSVKWKA